MSTVVRELRQEEIEEATIFLRDYFHADEPLMQTPGDHRLVYDDPQRRASRLALIRQGTCLVAVEGERFVGVALAGLVQPSDLAHNWQEVNERPPKSLVEHSHYFLCDLELKSRFFERYGASHALYLNVLAVDASRRRRGLGRRLVTALMSLGRAKELPLLVTTCTSFYSSRVMLALGMQCVLSAGYADYKDQAGNVVIRPPAPHTKASVMAIEL